MSSLRNRAIDASALDQEAVCKTCWAKSFSFCKPLHAADMGGFFSAAASLKVNPGTVFIHDGAKFPFYFNITRGATRSFKILPDGRRQILNFGVPGTLIGFSDRSIFDFSVESINEVSLCRFTKDKVDFYANKHPELRKSLLDKMMAELSESYAHTLVLGKMSARERLAFFLMKQNKTQFKIYGELNKINLPMNRYDISDYLGITTETVSRTFTQFENEGIITFIKASEIIVRDRRRLGALAGGGTRSPAIG